MKGPKLWLLITALGCLLCAGGCAAPNLRYARPLRQAAPKANEYKVPADWDYRAHYKVPADRLVQIIDLYIGTPYRYGGMGPKGMDCSGFVCVVFGRLNHARLPRSSRAMSKLGNPVSRQTARAGDLVFFRGGVFNSINHVGIFIEGQKFAHASRSKGVIYSMLDSEYYKKHFAGIRRIF